MKLKRSVYAVLIAVCFIACENKTEIVNTKAIDSIQINGPVQNPKSQEFPEKISLSKIRATEFILTPENKLSDSLNSIYSPTLLFAWQEIKDHLKSPIDISSSNSLDFKLINQSETFQNSLNKDEYETTIDVSNGIIATAYFKKSLPFKLELHTQYAPLNFNGTDVRSFGLNYPDGELLDYFQMLYYLDDEHFAIKLFPADTSSEIILAKGIHLKGSFSDVLKNTKKWMAIGSKEITTKGKEWKYVFKSGDKLSIPVMKFNIETQYASLEGQTFTSASKTHDIIKAYQRTAFVFDEYGAIVESFAAIAVDTTCVKPVPIEKPTPKKMIFDKPFVIFIKKKNSPNPYFAMKVMNAELMEKE
jgi:hypothetical protein